MARKRISDETRKKVAGDCRAGMSRQKVAEKHGISVTSVTRIVKEQWGGGPSPKPAVKESKPPEVKQKFSEIERRIRDLEEKILYLEARKQGKGTRL